MKTTINTKTVGQVIINSDYKGDEPWPADEKNENYHRHVINVSCGGEFFEFDFWGSIASPEISNDQENVFAFYCALSDGISVKDNSFEEFCNEFGYSDDSIKALRIYEACEETLNKVEGVFDCDLYDFINEIREDYDC